MVGWLNRKPSSRRRKDVLEAEPTLGEGVYISVGDVDSMSGQAMFKVG